MGNHPNVNYDKFPKQGWTGKRVAVAFYYETRNLVGGTVVRDDLEEPWVTIIRLDDGRHVLASECQYSDSPGRVPARQNGESGNG